MPQVIDLKNCVFTLEDGTAVTPLSLTLRVGEGTLTYSETQNREYILDRDNLDTVKDGPQVPMDVNVSFTFDEIMGDGTPSPVDFVKQKNDASAYVSTGAACEPYAVNIKVVHTPVCSTEKIQTWVFPDFRHEKIDVDMRGGTVSMAGKCNATEPTITRTAQ